MQMQFGQENKTHYGNVTVYLDRGKLVDYSWNWEVYKYKMYYFFHVQLDRVGIFEAV